MLDFGWTELIIVLAIAVLVVGPSDIPKLMYGLGRVLRRLQYMRFALSRQFEEFMQQSELEDLRRGVNFEQSRRAANETDEGEAGADKYEVDKDEADEDVK